MIITGIALEPHVETHGSSGINKVYPEDELREAASSLEGCPVTNSSGRATENVIGSVTEAYYKDGRGVFYEAEIFNEEWGVRVEKDELRVAPRLVHDSANTTDSSESPVEVSDVTFEGLFLCRATSDGVPGIGEWTVIGEHV